MFETDLEGGREHTGSFMYLSIPYYWLREVVQSLRAGRWNSAIATVESTYRSKGGYEETIRAELWYSYEFEGQHFSGRIVRDCGFNSGAVNNLVAHSVGERIVIRVNPEKPTQSYFPSGFGWIEPLIIGFISIGGTCLVVLSVLVPIIDHFRR
jgi:Protein of unknown function (DUF3592)